MIEIWKDIKTWESLYQVSDCGRVRSLDRVMHYTRGAKSWNRLKLGRALKAARHKDGYEVVRLCDIRGQKDYAIHRLVAEAFLKVPANYKDLEVNHINSIRWDNRVENLEWVTPKENVHHCMHQRQGRHAAAKLTADQVREIIMLYAQGTPTVDIVKKFNIVEQSATRIRRGATWKHIHKEVL